MKRLHAHDDVPQADDLELARRAAGGDRDAFASIYARYIPKVYGLLARMLTDPGDREDAAQDVFLQVHRSLPQFRGGSSLYTWIYRIACNVCLQHRRGKRRRREVALDVVAPSALPDQRIEGDYAPERASDRRQLLASVGAALARLPASQRIVIAMGPIQGQTYEEVASRLGVSVKVVKGRLHRGRASLRNMLRGRLALAA